MNKFTSKPHLRAVRMSLFPTMDSLDAVVQLAKAKPPKDSNEVFALLMTFQNTLLDQLEIN